MLRPDFAHDVEPVPSRHLYVEEHEVRLHVANRRHRVVAIVRLPDDLHGGVVAEHVDDPLTGQGLVVDHEHAHRRGHAPTSARSRNGMRTTASAPPASERRNSAR